MDLNTCALNTGTDIHLLDHIAPLASLLEIPLLVTEPENLKLAEHYYPEVITRFQPDLEFHLKDLAEEFDALIECKYWAPHLKTLFQTLFGKEMLLIFCPHGQSDKGYGAPLLAPYATQDAVLLYGDLLREMLQELSVWPFIHRSAIVGNYRQLYYNKHKDRLNQLANTEIFSQLKPHNRTLLYAPTWRDADGATSFFNSVAMIHQQLPEDWNVIVKVHPLLSQRDPALFYRLAHLQKPNWLLVEQFPPVYPILDRVDAYLGDYSSVGYDALAFHKPLYFLPQHNLPPARLHSCGQKIEAKRLFQTIDETLCKAKNFETTQTDLYQKAFSPITNLKLALQSLIGGRTKTDIKSPIFPAAGSASKS